MNTREIRHRIATFRRHYDLPGDAILACYETAAIGLGHNTPVEYTTISVSPTNWKKLADKLDISDQVKHPGSKVPCLKIFNKLYVRAESRIPDQDVSWSSAINCYVPTIEYLYHSLQHVVMASKSTKGQVEYAQGLLRVLSLPRR